MFCTTSPGFVLLPHINRVPVQRGPPAPAASARAAKALAGMLPFSGCPSASASRCLVPRILFALAAALVPEDKELATRLHSQTMLNKLAPIIPGFWGGSAGEQGSTALHESADLRLGVLERGQHSCHCVAGCEATRSPLSALSGSSSQEAGTQM